MQQIGRSLLKEKFDLFYVDITISDNVVNQEQ